MYVIRRYLAVKYLGRYHDDTQLIIVSRDKTKTTFVPEDASTHMILMATDKILLGTALVESNKIVSRIEVHDLPSYGRAVFTDKHVTWEFTHMCSGWCFNFKITKETSPLKLNNAFHDLIITCDV